jgi:ribosomal protein S27E
MTSKYLKVKCKCGEESVIFSNVTRNVHCGKCNEILAEPRGGMAHVLGKIVEEYK